jgi:hypothetical protein
MHRILLLGLAALLGLSGLVAAQETSTAVLKQLIDNERVRVFEATFKPGAKLATRNYPNHMVYAPAEGTLVFTPVGRRGYEVNFNAGDAMWFGPLARATENDSDREVRVLIVEFKDGGGRAAARAARGGKGKAKARRAGGKAKGKK